MVITVAIASRVRCPPDRVPTVARGIERAESQFLGGDLRAAVGVPGIVVDGVLEGRGVRRLARVVVQVAGELLDPSHGVTQRSQGRGQHLADGPVVAERRFLAQQHQVGRRLDGAGHPGRLGQPARDRPQQGRLAGAVLTDQPDPPPRLRDQVDPGQGGAVPERDGQVAEHDGLKGRHAVVLTGGTRLAGQRRGRESGQAEIHMMRPGYRLSCVP